MDGRQVGINTSSPKASHATWDLALGCPHHNLKDNKRNKHQIRQKPSTILLSFFDSKITHHGIEQLSTCRCSGR